MTLFSTVSSKSSLVHSRQFRLKHDLILVLVDVDAGIPGAPANSLFPEPSGQVSRKQAVHLLLQTAQVAEWVIANDSSFKTSPP